MRRRPVLALVIVLALSVSLPTVGLATAQDEIQSVRGEPDLEVYVPEPELAPGSSGQLVLQVANRGEIEMGANPNREIVTTARGVTVDITDSGPFEVSTQRQAIGSVADGSVQDVPIALTVPEDVEPGEYSIDVRLRYAHTYQYAARSGVVSERTRSVRTSVDVVVDDGARFSLRTVESDVQVGERGTFETELRNVGDEVARDITLELESRTTDVLLGDGAENTARIERLEPGENATIPFDASVGESVSARNMTLAGSVEFVDANGVRDAQSDLSIGLDPAAEQSFALDVETSTLRVGELGAIEGTITNDGPDAAGNVVVSLGESQLEPRSRTYAVGDLAPGTSATFRFRGVVPPEADAVPQRLDVTTAYRTAAGNDRTTSDPIRVEVAERRDAIGVRPVDAAFTAGETDALELEITNRRDAPISDVRVHLGVEAPLESDFRTAVVPNLGPGETDRVAFDLEVDGDAPASRYPATVDVEYTDPDDEPATARSSTVAVEVSESETELPLAQIAGVALVLVLVGVGGWWFYGRRLV